jgi:hypothetical protein
MKNLARNNYLTDLILRSARIASIFAIFYAIVIYVGANKQKIAFTFLGVGVAGLSNILLNKYGVKHHSSYLD